MTRLRAWASDLFAGSVSPWAYAILRVGLATLVLLRTTTFPWLPMDHHDWVVGLEYHPAHDHAEIPRLHSPLWPGLPAFGPGLSAALVWTRTLLAGLLLVGVRPRVVAAALALVGYALMASDRYRYLHHLHLLWVSVGLLALLPSGQRLAPLGRLGWFGADRSAETVARWPLQLVRLHLCVVYVAAAAAKLEMRWVSGRTLRDLHAADLITGPLAELAMRAPAAAAGAIAATELLIPLLLLIPRARWAGLALAVAFHISVELSMMVSTFGATMLLLATAFLPFWSREDSVEQTS